MGETEAPPALERDGDAGARKVENEAIVLLANLLADLDLERPARAQQRRPCGPRIPQACA